MSSRRWSVRAGRRWLVVLGGSILAGCAALVGKNLDRTFGEAQPKSLAAAVSQPALEYAHDVRPVLERRCVVCHGCYDAPCQLKLEDYAGLLRGANGQPVYDGARVAEVEPSRLHVDAASTAAWRARGFHAVLNERGESPRANLEAGLMARMLELRRLHPLPADTVLPDTFDFSRERTAQCPSIESFDLFAKRFPLWSMPFGLPDLPAGEFEVLTSWLAAGAPASPDPPIPAELDAEAGAWEAFFNGDTRKQRLVARYLYEHLFLAHLYLEDAGRNTVFFKLVRSRTPPGRPIDLIPSRRPFEDPNVAHVYYRLWRDPESVVDKTHMPYALTSARRAQWTRWFIDPEYDVADLPDYSPRVAANPFIAFEAIPVSARHRFLLDEAQFTIMNFIKGPVCRGTVALNVIRDRFWVFFTTPGFLDSRDYGRFLAAQEDHLRLPAEAGSGPWSIAQWVKYATAQRAYLRAKIAFIKDQRATFNRGKMGVIWDGDGTNSNAALTVFRHHDSASVVRGLVGEPPQTAWVIDYPTLERIHYLLVAGFDVFGSASHQAMTRLYMDFLRMESEMNFLAFLPPATRQHEIADWYRDAERHVRNYLKVYFTGDVIDPLYEYRTGDHKRELFGALQSRVARALGPDPTALEAAGLPARAQEALHALTRLRGTAVSLLPETVFVNVRGQGALTLLRDSAYTNVSSMFRDENRRVPAEDSLTVVNGLLGAYPNVFLDVDPADIPDLANAVSRLRDEADYRALLDRFGVRRTNPRFWAVSDEVLDKQRHLQPLAGGIFDYNRLENR